MNKNTFHFIKAAVDGGFVPASRQAWTSYQVYVWNANNTTIFHSRLEDHKLDIGAK